MRSFSVFSISETCDCITFLPDTRFLHRRLKLSDTHLQLKCAGIEAGRRLTNKPAVNLSFKATEDSPTLEGKHRRAGSVDLLPKRVELQT
jgi:hypothetical protein